MPWPWMCNFESTESRKSYCIKNKNLFLNVSQIMYLYLCIFVGRTKSYYEYIKENISNNSVENKVDTGIGLVILGTKYSEIIQKLVLN